MGSSPLPLPLHLHLLWALLSALWAAEVEMHMTHRRSADFFAAGLVFKLQCNRNRQNVSVRWSRVPDRSLENIAGVAVREDALWFLPAELVHSGEYSCLSRKGNETWETVFTVTVHNETCPRLDRKDDVKSTKGLACLLPHIFELDPGAQVTWRNNCLPLNGTYGRVFPVDRSPERAGLYTCFVRFTFEGQSFSAAQTTEIYRHHLVVTRPEIIYPVEVNHTVTLGQSYELRCKALVGENGLDETEMLWMSEPESLALSYESTTLSEDGRRYILSVLSISEVTAEYLFANLTCLVLHPAGSDSVRVQLIPESQKERHYWIGLGLVALVAILGGVAFLFRVDLVLVYRDVCPSTAVCNDGKSYDAYVSYLYGDQLSSSTAMTFALHFLPAVLEDHYGYKLFIGGRDELPGESVHEVVADRMSRSRRLIIVLTSQCQSAAPEKALLSDAGVRLESSSLYEQRLGLYAALVKQGLEVILVQVEDGLDEALLPESLRYVRRTRGVLRWRQNAGDRANRRFWKHLRYHMPAAQRR